jgi:microcystin-dependent protein
LLGAGSTYSAGSTGGEASHTLTYSELPETNGVITMHHAAIGTNIAGVGGCFTGDSIVQGKYRQGGTLLDANTISIGQIKYTNGGENKAHNNMPPYLTVYM